VTTSGENASAAFTGRERWILLIASAWLVIGLLLDAYAHATTPELETFWTPWHAVLYSGIGVSGLTLLWLVRPRLPTLTYQSVLALPGALRIPLAGMALLLVGGGVDTLWHNVFGIEDGLEIFVSPSHILIILGMSVVAAGPALMLATKPGRRLSVPDSVLVTASALLSVLPLHIFSLHASALGTVFLGMGNNPVDVYSPDAQMVHSYVFSTVLLLLPILIIGRRWRLPIGVPTVLVAMPAVLMHLMFMSEESWWLALTVADCAAGAEAVFRVGAQVVPLPAQARWIALGLIAPPLLWGAVFVVGASTIGVGWNIHMVSGVLTMVAVAGVVTVLVTRNVRAAPATRTAAADRAGVSAP